jgi:glycosyltransferase involved in cell wall biosynthesis
VSRLAIVHEWLASRAGSEKVFEAMASAYPDADLWALTREPGVRFDFGGRPVHTTMLDVAGPLRRRRNLTLPLMPLAWTMAGRGRHYDVVVTSSHAFTKAFHPGRDAIQLCYTHAPARYLWDTEIDTRGGRAAVLIDPVRGRLRDLDRRLAVRVDHFAANSRAVAERVRRFYGREAVVIAPPVDTEFYTPVPHPPGRAVLAVSRFIPYKRLDLAIEACAAAEVPLIVAGGGPEETRLRALAEGHDVRFEIDPDDARLRHLYREAAALVFPAEEDFGIVTVEAQACGRPVVALGAGGSLDTVIDGATGAHVADQEVASWAEAIRRVVDDPPAVEACRAHAETFSALRFRSNFQNWVDPHLG